MGTRALISINSKPFIATHWDGDPDSLGSDLLGICIKDNDNFKNDIINVAKEHSMDAVDTKDEIFAPEVLARFQKIADKTKGKYTAEQLKKLYDEENKVIQFGLMCSDDWPMCDVKNYGDFAEYHYDLTDGNWTYRELNGQWSKQKNKSGKGKMLPLSTESIKAWVIKRDKRNKACRKKYEKEARKAKNAEIAKASMLFRFNSTS